MKLKLKLRISIVDFLLEAYLLFVLSGGTYGRFIYYEMAFCILVLSITMTKCSQVINDKRILYAVIFLLIVLIYGSVTDGFLSAIKYVGAYTIYFSGIPVFIYYKNEMDFYRKKRFVLFLIAIIVFFAFYAIVSYKVYGINARSLAMNSNAYGERVIGTGYPIAWASSIFSVYFACILKKGELELNKRIFCLLFIIMTFYLLILTTSTITLIVWLVSMIITIVLPGNKSNGLSNVLQVVIIAVIFLVVTSIFTSFFGELIVEYTKGKTDILSLRLNSFGQFISGETSTYANGRFLIPLRSLHTFFKHPILGISYTYGLNYYNKLLGGAGGHCEWIDAFTCFGLLGGICYSSIFINTIRKIYENETISLAFAICVFLLGVFNPVVSNPTCIVLFPAIPCISVFRREIRNEKEIETTY